MARGPGCRGDAGESPCPGGLERADRRHQTVASGRTEEHLRPDGGEASCDGRGECPAGFIAHEKHDARLRAELPRRARDAGRELVGDCLAPFRECSRQEHDRVHAPHLHPDDAARGTRRSEEFFSGTLAAGEAGRANTRIGNEPFAIGGVECVEELHRRRGQASLLQGGTSLLRGEPGDAGMPLVGLGDHGVARGDRRGEVATCDGAVGERKVGRRKHDHRPEPGRGGADVLRVVDHRHPPRALPRGGGGLP